ncbi:MAG: RNA polymerase sigma factor FliA [Polyangiaceae bacterium]|nr:RNA polymerase sigma factor FliA [Polyangiaceae bacterium]
MRQPTTSIELLPVRGSAEAHADLVDRYMPLVRRISMRAVRKLPPSITVDDLVSAGWVGLLEAFDRRTPEMNEEQFEAYASHRVRGAILDYLRSLDPMGRKMRSASRRIVQTMSELTASLGRAPETEEVARALGLTLDDYHSLLTDISEAGSARLELSEVAEPASPDASPEAQAGRRAEVGSVAEAVEQLPERLQLILGLYYQEDCSFREIGEVLDISESRACQLHIEAIHRIRATLHGRAYRRGSLGKSVYV